MFGLAERRILRMAPMDRVKERGPFRCVFQ